MAFTKRELGHIEETVGALCHRRTSPRFKNQLSIEYRVKRHDVTIVERRPHWTGKPGFTERECAKFKFARATEQRRLRWMRADLKWHAYKVEGNKVLPDRASRSGTGDIRS
jgi:hypothetical protein